jgi:phage baseplate assembly protein W
MMPISRAALSESLQRSVGATDYIIEPFQNDLQFDSAKHLRTISGTAKLVQAILRIMLTSQGEYIEDAQWGAGIGTMIGSKLDSGVFSTASENIISALKHYNSVNADNPDPDEIIDSIDELRVVQDLDDPRVMRVVLGITTESGKSMRVSVPQTEK